MLCDEERILVGQGRPDVRGKCQKEDATFADFITEASISGARVGALELLPFCSAENVHASVGSSSGKSTQSTLRGLIVASCCGIIQLTSSIMLNVVEAEWRAKDEAGGLKPPACVEASDAHCLTWRRRLAQGPL